VGDGGIGLTLSIHTQTPLFWQLVGSLAPAPKMASMTEPSASKMIPSG
jgi:hypothetical protein